MRTKEVLQMMTEWDYSLHRVGEGNGGVHEVLSVRSCSGENLGDLTDY